MRIGYSLELNALTEAEFQALPEYAQADLVNALAASHGAGHAATTARLANAAIAFLERHGKGPAGPLGALLFILPPQGMTVIGPLAGDLINALGANEYSRSFLRHLDEATDHEATIGMAISMIEGVGLPTTEASAGSPWAFLLWSQGPVS
jgi:hypothetical protein